MARKPRSDHPGALHHVTCRANPGCVLFHDESDRLVFLRELRSASQTARWIVLAYCLMDNHVHLLIETPCGGLAKGMQLLNGRYARRLHGRHGSFGHVYQGRYYAKPVTDDRQLFATVAYIARNPVVAGTCAHPGDWPWSSHRAQAQGRDGGLIAISRLHDLLSERSGDGVAQYRSLTGDGDSAVPEPIALPPAVPLASLVRDGDAASIAVAHLEHCYSVREIAAAMGLSPATVARRLKQGRTEWRSSGDEMKQTR